MMRFHERKPPRYDLVTASPELGELDSLDVEDPSRDAAPHSERRRFERAREWLVPAGDEESANRGVAVWATLGLFAILAVGAAVRVWAARYVSPHVDEPASLLPAVMVAERGWPKFPSGSPYL